jgi:hypothetical protein
MAPDKVHRRQTALARQVPAVNIELLTTAGCPHEAAAVELITTALADTGVKAVITRTIITSQDDARQRGFIGSPTILLNETDPFHRPDAPVALACRLYTTPDGLRGVPALRDLRQALKRAAAPEPGQRARG